MNQFDKFSEKTLMVWTCCCILVAVGLRLYMWRVPYWTPGKLDGQLSGCAADVALVCDVGGARRCHFAAFAAELLLQVLA